jgi:hypothetical protein
MNRLLTILCIALLATACRSTRKIGVAINNRKDSAQTTQVAIGRADSLAFMRQVTQRMEANHVNFNTFSSKVNIDYKDATNKNYNVNSTLRMWRDSAIWISANAILGVEALRVLITRDSVKILDKLNHVYTARSMQYLQEQVGLPLTLRNMQELIVGNPIFLDSSSSYVRDGATGTVTVLSLGTMFKHLLTLNESDGTLVHSKIDDIDPTMSRTADITYADYDRKAGIPFSTRRRLLLSEVKKLDISLDFRQYSVDVPVSFPFSVPRNFKRS